MRLTRRELFKGLLGGATAGPVLALGWGPEKALAQVPARVDVLRRKPTTTICPYSGVGCGLVVYAEDGKLVNAEGDPVSVLTAHDGQLGPGRVRRR